MRRGRCLPSTLIHLSQVPFNHKGPGIEKEIGIREIERKLFDEEAHSALCGYLSGTFWVALRYQLVHWGKGSEEEVGRRGAVSGETVGAAQAAVPCRASQVEPVEGRGRAARRCGAVSDIAVSLDQHV